MCFSPIFFGSRHFLPIFGEGSYDALEREGARGREARVQSEESCSRGGRGTEQRQGETQLCFGEDEETQAGRDRARHGCVLVRMKKHKVKTTGYCGGTKEEEDRGALLRA